VKATVDSLKKEYTPRTLTLVIESASEERALRSLVQLDITVPDAVDYAGWMNFETKAQDKATLRAILKTIRVALLF
jgi:hypothetical protein